MYESFDVEGEALLQKDQHVRENLLHHVLGPMQSCFGHATSCQQLLLLCDDDVQQTAKSLLKELRKEGKPRSAALRSLYLLTDSERHYNRCVDNLDSMHAAAFRLTSQVDHFNISTTVYSPSVSKYTTAALLYAPQNLMP
jgi:hypothetical protein